MNVTGKGFFNKDYIYSQLDAQKDYTTYLGNGRIKIIKAQPSNSTSKFTSAANEKISADLTITAKS